MSGFYTARTPPDGQFATFSTWANKARSWIGGTGAVCLDAKNRRCRIGADFMRAEREGAFPVRYWFPDTPRTGEETKP